jgi:hypothetical protein
MAAHREEQDVSHHSWEGFESSELSRKSNEETSLWPMDLSDLDHLDPFDPNVLNDISPDITNEGDETQQQYSTGAGPWHVAVSWHCNEEILNRVFTILSSREVPEGIPVFPSPPDHENLIDYFLSNRDPNKALYVVQKQSNDSAIFSPLKSVKPKLGHDWGPGIDHHPRFHLVMGCWCTNERKAPADTTASLIYRGANFSKTLKKHPFERKLKPWRCAGARERRAADPARDR